MMSSSTPAHCYSPRPGVQTCYGMVNGIPTGKVITPTPLPPSPNLHCYHPQPHMTVCSPNNPNNPIFTLVVISVWGVLILSLLLTAAGIQWRRPFLLALAAVFSACFAFVGLSFTFYWIFLLPIPAAQIWGAIRLQGNNSGPIEPSGDAPLPPLQALFRAMIRPAETFRRLSGNQLNFLKPGILLATFNLVLLASHLNWQLSQAASPIPGRLYFVIPMIVAGFLRPWIYWGEVALALYLAAFLLCPKNNDYLRWYAVAVFAYLPTLLSGFLTAIFPNRSIMSGWPLPFLSLGYLLPQTFLSTHIGIFLSQVTPFALWSLLIAAEGFSTYGHLPRWKATVTVVVLWLLQISSLALFSGINR